MRINSNNTDFTTIINLITSNLNDVISISAEVKNNLIPQILHTSAWPEAVANGLIVRDEQTKAIRANAILTSFIRESVKDKKMLDVGCGDGSIVIEANKRKAAVAIGYDIVSVNENVVTDMSIVETNAPYDIIMAYDVLDHIVDDNERAAVLTMLRKNIKPSGKIYVRCHPFTSRHGCHNYYKLNKAYAHLFMSDTELAQYDPLPTVRTITPMVTYKQWFAESGLKILDENLSRKDLEDFFTDLSRPLMNRLSGNPYVRDLQTLNGVLSIQFADFVLQAI